LYKRKRHIYRNEERKSKIIDVLSKKQKDLTIVLEEVHDPHNISAVLRTCDAVGIVDVDVVYKDGREISLGKKSSASAAKWVDVNVYNDINKVYKKHKKEKRIILSTSLNDNSKSIYDIDFTQPVTLVFGNEKLGLTDEAIEKSDESIIIPQLGMIQSLNISVAVAITLYEAYRQRLKAGMYDDLNLNQQVYDNLLTDWLLR